LAADHNLSNLNNSESMNLEYNSNREKLTISEYGRHVQNLVQYAMTIEDDVQRQLFVEMIINLMYQIVPSSTRQSREVTERLWNHVLRIADYKLDVTPPEDLVIVTKEKRRKPIMLEYPKRNLKHRSYGFYVQELIEKGKEAKDEESRKAFANVIGSYMKMATRNWGHEQSVNDEVIKNDLRRISDKVLSLTEGEQLDYLGDQSQMVPRRKKPTHKSLSYSNQQNKKKRRKPKKRYTN
jgi:hypothetical protein